jgi:ligand-binding sensor domain-containing protein/serine phosphatase RsbU (regulator of sigma subunit)
MMFVLLEFACDIPNLKLKAIIKYIFIALAVVSCTSEQTNDPVETEKDLTVRASGKEIPSNKFAEPKIITAKSPIPAAIKETTVLPYTNNIHPLVNRQIFPLEKDIFEDNYSELKGKPIVTSVVERTLACILPEPVPMQSLRFKDEATCNIQYIDVVQGFSSSYVKSLLQDNKENIWVGTPDNLVIYNGRSLVSFSEKNELLQLHSFYMRKDIEGNVWLRAKDCILKYNGKHFFVYDSIGGLPSSKIYSFVFDKDNLMWISSRAGLSSFDGKTCITYNNSNGYNFRAANMKCDSKKNIWCGSVQGVCCFNGKRFAYVNKKNGLYSDLVATIIEDKLGNIWFSGGGVTKFDWHSFEHFTDKQGMINNDVRKTIADNDGNLWFSAYRGGVSCFDGKNFSWYTEKEGLTVNTVDALQEDRNGNIWIGTDGGGLCRYSKGSFNHFTDKEILNRIVTCLNEDNNGNVWLSSYDEGIFKYDGEKFITYNETTRSNFIYNDGGGTMYFGTVGILKLENGKFSRYTTEQGLPTNVIGAMYKDKDGVLWIGTHHFGILKFDGKQFLHYDKEQGLPEDIIVTAFSQDKNGAMWIATSKGLLQMSQNGIRHFTTYDGLLENDIKCMKLDRQGNIWIGTSKGLNRYDGKRMMKITADDGLSNEVIRSIIEDKAESVKAGHTGLWISTDYGIDRLIINNDDSLGTDIKLFVYTRPDGLRGEDFCTNSGLMDSKGRAWWGSVKGLTTLQTTDLYIDRDIPDVHLDYIGLEQNYVDFRSLKDSISTGKNWFIGEKKELNLKNVHFTDVPAFRNYPLELELPYNINNITFNYSAINWLNQHKLRYQYMLEGSDNEWHPVTANNNAVYTDLDPGTYTFKVRARGLLEVWSKPAEYTFRVLPPWWKTIWAYIIYVLTVVTALIFYFNWRTRALRKRQKELEQIIVERTADVVDEKNKVEEKNKIIEEKQKEIFDSLQYAKQIQKLLLANHKLVNETLPDSFVMFKPRDIVSGDFYWAAKKEDRFYLAVCDSTGHGVPGAFMSLLNINFLNEAVVEKNIADPNEVFNYVRKRLIDNISQQGRQDGMDGILICVNEKTKRITYAAANNAPVVIRKNKLEVLEADKMPIGKGEKNESFKLYPLDVAKGDMLMLYTDGYADQFGGPKGKKFKYKLLNDMLLQNNHLPVIEQEEHLYAQFDKWKGDLEQVDDVCILGIKF